MVTRQKNRQHNSDYTFGIFKLFLT
jgi:hypothetical protein